jgi:hypothetical protein
MGAWGYGIRQDDFVCDVIGAFESLLKAGSSVADATKSIQAKFAAERKDSDDGPQFWIALADAQWIYGKLDSQVLKRVQDDFRSGRSLTLWEEDPRGLARRKAALQKFIDKLRTTNPRPKKPPNVVKRPPKFQAGDCLSILLSNGEYGAAIVLAADHSNVEYGKNLVGVIDYLSSEKPSMKVFETRKWLLLTHHGWNNRREIAWYRSVGFRAVKDRLDIIGQVKVLDSDVQECNSYCAWAGIADQVLLQHDWDAGKR